MKDICWIFIVTILLFVVFVIASSVNGEKDLQNSINNEISINKVKDIDELCLLFKKEKEYNMTNKTLTGVTAKYDNVEKKCVFHDDVNNKVILGADVNISTVVKTFEYNRTAATENKRLDKLF